MYRALVSFCAEGSQFESCWDHRLFFLKFFIQTKALETKWAVTKTDSRGLVEFLNWEHCCVVQSHATSGSKMALPQRIRLSRYSQLGFLKALDSIFVVMLIFPHFFHSRGSGIPASFWNFPRDPAGITINKKSIQKSTFWTHYKLHEGGTKFQITFF